MGRSILAVLLATILAISRVSINLSQYLLVIVYHLCSTPSMSVSDCKLDALLDYLRD